MGIKFEILCDAFLTEDSELSKHFTSSAPVKVIHTELGLDANTQPVLKGRNRHDAWADLLAGEALFIVIDKPLDLQKARQDLDDVFNDVPAESKDKTKSLNVMRQNIRQALRIAPEEAVADKETVKRLEKLLFGRSQYNKRTGKRTSLSGGVAGAVADVYGERAVEKMDDLWKFISAITEADRFMIKRITQDRTDRSTSPQDYQKIKKPEQRKFPIGVQDPSSKPADGRQYVKGRVYKQQYNVWMFSKDSLTQKFTWNKNIRHLFRPPKGGMKELEGWDQRNYYLISNVDFKIPEEKTNNIVIFSSEVAINRFILDSVAKYQPVISKKIAEHEDAMKQRAQSQEADPNVTETEAEAAKEDYTNMLAVMNGSILFDTKKMFVNFIENTTVATDTLIRDIGSAKSNKYSSDRQGIYFKVKSKDDAGDPIRPIQSGGMPPLTPQTQTELMGAFIDAISGGYRMRSEVELHIDPEAYSEFQKKFIIFLLRRIIKTTASSALEDILMGL